MTPLPAALQAEIAQWMSTGRYESEAELLRGALAALRMQQVYSTKRRTKAKSDPNEDCGEIPL
jgi:Arc/MetJ-type ribon-helix-helix transcriptional regulator